MGMGWCGSTYLVEAPVVKGCGYGACRKGRNGGSGIKHCLWGQYMKASGGVWRSRLVKKDGVNNENNWIRLHCRGQRGGVGGL
jgi:hypothetical protein